MLRSSPAVRQQVLLFNADYAAAMQSLTKARGGRLTTASAKHGDLAISSIGLLNT
jgi:hypothetical protein